MERNLQKGGVINLLVLLAVGLAAFLVARIGHSLSGQVTVWFLGLGTLVALVSWFQMRLEDRERLERLEFDELTRSKSASGLFQTQDAEGFLARRTREQFERWLVPAFSIILLLIQGGGALLLWRWLAQPTTATELTQPMMTMSLFGLFALILFLVGRFSATMARLEDNRLLRPTANYVLLCSYLAALTCLSVVGVLAEFPTTDLIVAKVLCGLLALLAVEMAVNLLLELYRPRVKGRITRPLYESRLVALLAHPEDVFSTAAHALDYQFGFKVSETWFYRFLQKALGWLILLQVGVLLLSSCLVIIEPGERGLLERWGRFVSERGELGPGAHIKWPWPVDQIRRFRTEQFQTFLVGSQPDPDQPELQAVLWNVSHMKEELLLVGTREQTATEAVSPDSERRTPPVSLLTVSFPVHYEISDLQQWAYNHENASVLLQDIATRQVVQYLAGSDIHEVMGSGRLGGGELLRERIQSDADRRELGVRVVFIGLQDIHPPVAVAPDFQKVVGAIQEKEAKILSAQADAIRTNALAGSRAFTLVAEAESARKHAEVNSVARSALFTNQIPAYRAAPSVYVQREFFQTFAAASADARKYILLTTNTEDVVQIDLQDKIARDLLNMRAAPP